MAQSTENQKIDLTVLQKLIDKNNASLIKLDKEGLRTFTFAKERIEILKERTSKLKKEQEELAKSQEKLTAKLNKGEITTKEFTESLRKLNASYADSKKNLKEVQKEEDSYLKNLENQKKAS